jgi:hypothetical protein
MTRAVVSGHTGNEWRDIAALTFPGFADYANRHGASFISFDPIADCGRPPAWSKLVAIAEAFADHDEVLWLDADVLIVDGSESLFDAVPGWADQALVEHPNPTHMNTGVWLLRRRMIPVVTLACMRDELIHHRWWEQAAINEITLERKIPTHVLGGEWNRWHGDTSDTPPRFLHACGLKHSRLETLKGWSRDHSPH